MKYIAAFLPILIGIIPSCLQAQLPIPVTSHLCDTAQATVCFSAYDSTWMTSTHTWDFGDGSPLDTNFNACHTYSTWPASFTVVFTITNPNGTVTDTINILLNASGYCASPPQGSFQYSWYNCEGDSVSFFDQSANFPLSWSWSFPGGSPATSTLQNPKIMYPALGIYPVTMMVSNGYGTDTVIQNVTINSCPPLAMPSHWCGGIPGEVYFEDSLSSNCGQNCVYAWDFGDGSPIDNTVSPTHVYLIYPATYTVTLTISNPSGVSSNTMTVTLDAAGNCGNLVLPPAQGYFGFSCSGNGWIQFNDSSLNTPTFWLWDFGDGSPNSNQQNPLHQYTQFPATYSVLLYVSNSYGSDWFSVVVALDGAGNCISLNTVNMISGVRYHDFNKNCVQDSAEYGLPNRLMQALPGPYFAYTNSSGNYTIYVDTGTYSVTEIPYTGWGQYCPIFPNGYPSSFWNYGNDSQWNDFGDTISASCPDLRLGMTTWNAVPCNSNSTYIHYQNFGSLIANGVSISVTFDPLYTLINSTPAWTSLVGNTATWNLGSIPSGQWGNIYVTHTLSCSAQLGNFLTLTGVITPTSGDCDVSDNTITEYTVVKNSWDPNDKWVKARDFSLNGYVQTDTISSLDDLEYLINFQNTGTSPAINITLIDTIDPALDITSIQPLMSSHPYTSFSLLGPNVVRWVFNNINLPDSGSNQLASHGFVKYAIKQNPGNLNGTQIFNRAGIFFDNNPAILTNNTISVIDISLGLTEVVQYSNFFLVYPNPSSGSMYLEIKTDKSNWCTLHLYSAQGALILSENISSKNKTILHKQIPGIYFLEILNGEGSRIVKKIVFY